MTEISAAEFASLANDVYRDGKDSKCLRWNRYDYRVGSGGSNGLFCAAYVTPRTKVLVVAIRGTDDGHDFLQDARLVASGAPWQQFNSALGYFDMWRKHLKGWSSDVAVCGHSLGGAIAAMIGMTRGVPAVTFNTAPIAPAVGSGLRAMGSSDRMVYNFRNKGDAVSGILPVGVGRTIELRKEAQLNRMLRGRWAGADAVNHSMSTLLEAILQHPNSQLSPDRWASR